MDYKYLDIDLKPFIEKLRSFRLLEMYKFNGFLGDLTDYIYDTFEELENLNISEVKNPQIIIKKLRILHPQMVELNLLLDKLYQHFDDKYMCRLVDISFPLEKTIEEKLNMLE